MGRLQALWSFFRGYENHCIGRLREANQGYAHASTLAQKHAAVFEPPFTAVLCCLAPVEEVPKDAPVSAVSRPITRTVRHKHRPDTVASKLSIFSKWADDYDFDFDGALARHRLHRPDSPESPLQEEIDRMPLIRACTPPSFDLPWSVRSPTPALCEYKVRQKRLLPPGPIHEEARASWPGSQHRKGVRENPKKEEGVLAEGMAQAKIPNELNRVPDPDAGLYKLAQAVKKAVKYSEVMRMSDVVERMSE